MSNPSAPLQAISAKKVVAIYAKHTIIASIMALL
jgi:hypothetical protein